MNTTANNLFPNKITFTGTIEVRASKYLLRGEFAHNDHTGENIGDLGDGGKFLDTTPKGIIHGSP